MCGNACGKPSMRDTTRQPVPRRSASRWHRSHARSRNDELWDRCGHRRFPGDLPGKELRCRHRSAHQWKPIPTGDAKHTVVSFTQPTASPSAQPASAAPAWREAGRETTHTEGKQKEAARAAWREHAATRPPGDLVILDDTGSHRTRTPLDADAPCGTRAGGSVPRTSGRTLTGMASRSRAGMGEALLLDGSAAAAAFAGSLAQILAPSWRPGHIVLLDTRSIHLGSRVKEAMDVRGCPLLPVPTSSPDCSPIDGAWSTRTAILRRVGARTRETLHEARREAWPRIPPADALGWFLHGGSPAPSQEESAQPF